MTLPTYLRWPGRKTDLMPRIVDAFARGGGEAPDLWVEPFCGSAAGALYIKQHQPLGLRDTLVADANRALVNLHLAVHASHDLVSILLESLPQEDWRERYYEVRDLYNKERKPHQLLWLNGVCFNGLYRENAAGNFNVPVGRYKTPRWPSPEVLQEAAALWGRGASLFSATNLKGFVIPGMTERAWVYCDPPYVPAENMGSGFTAYAGGGFSSKDQEHLVRRAEMWAARGHRVVVSNHDTPYTRDLYDPTRGWEVESFPVQRRISAKSKGRKVVHELLAAIG